MVDPRNAREVAIDLEGFKTATEWRIDLLLKLGGMLIALVIGIAGGGYAIYSQIGNVRTDVEVIKKEVEVIDARTRKLEANSDEGAKSSERIEASLSRLEGQRAAPTPKADSFVPLALTVGDNRIIQELLGLRSRISGPPNFKLGDWVPTTSTKPLPDQLIAKLPKLKEVSYLIDSNGWAILADTRGRVVAVVGPLIGSTG